MNVKITWTLFLNISNPAKAPKIIASFVECVGLETRVGQPERYWKDKHLYKIVA